MFNLQIGTKLHKVFFLLKLRQISVLALLVSFGLSSTLFAKEHAGKEHAGKAVNVSAKDIKAKIKSYIKKDTKMKGGSFLIYDEKLDKTWRLSFVKIHDPVRIIKDKTYFACMDFQEVGGKNTLDLDFWLEVQKGSHKLKITAIKIHKLNGKARFTYIKDNPVPVE